MKCEQIKELLVAFLDGSIEDSRKAEIQLHIEKCHDCRKEAALLEKSWQMLDGYEVPKLRDDFTSSVMGKIHSVQPQQQLHNVSLWRFWRRSFAWSAAAVLVLAAISSFILLDRKPADTKQVAGEDKIEKTTQQQQVELVKSQKEVVPVVADTDEEIIRNLDIFVNLKLLENMELLEVMDELEKEEKETDIIVVCNYVHQS